MPIMVIAYEDFHESYGSCMEAIWLKLMEISIKTFTWLITQSTISNIFQNTYFEWKVNNDWWALSIMATRWKVMNELDAFNEKWMTMSQLHLLWMKNKNSWINFIHESQFRWSWFEFHLVNRWTTNLNIIQYNRLQDIACDICSNF